MNLLNHYPEIVAAYPEYITQKQLCEVCGVCHKTAYNLERRGEIPYKVVDTPTGRIHHIKLIDALAYEAQSQLSQCRPGVGGTCDTCPVAGGAACHRL